MVLPIGLEAGLPVDASLHLGHEERQVHVDRLVELVYLLLDVPVLLGVLCLQDGLVAGCGGEVGVGDDALPDELVLSEPPVVFVHAPVVGAGGGCAGLAVPFGLGRRSSPEDSPEPSQQPRHG